MNIFLIELKFPHSWVRLMAEHAMCVIHNVPVYITPGAVTHSVISAKKFHWKVSMNFEHYWQSMLENWAHVNRIYIKECCGNKMRTIGYCLLRLSRSLQLMFDAMVQVCSFNLSTCLKGFYD